MSRPTKKAYRTVLNQSIQDGYVIGLKVVAVAILLAAGAYYQWPLYGVSLVVAAGGVIYAVGAHREFSAMKRKVSSEPCLVCGAVGDQECDAGLHG